MTAKKPTEQEIIATFQKLRNERQMIAAKAAELQVEQKSHELVLDSLKEVEKDRKCFRMIGGVLVERTVNEVVPALEQNKQQITNLIATLESQLEAKIKEIDEFRIKYDVRIQTEQGEEKKAVVAAADQAKSSGGVLVDN